jgi:hypothetical protein
VIDALSCGASTEVAVIVIISNCAAGGALKLACVGEEFGNTPQPATVSTIPVQRFPLTLHVTPSCGVGSLTTVAEKFAVVSGMTLLPGAGPVIETDSGYTVIVWDAVRVVLVVEVAVTVTVMELPGMDTGARYCTLVAVALASVPQPLLGQPLPLPMVHVTPVGLAAAKIE